MCEEMEGRKKERKKEERKDKNKIEIFMIVF